MPNEFLIHGKTNISIENNLIVVESTGPWNEEYFHNLHREIVFAVTKVDINNYGILLIPYGEAIGTPAAMASHIEMIREAKTKAVAINLSQCDTPQSTKKLCCIAYETATFMFDFFDSNEQAKAWLQTKLN